MRTRFSCIPRVYLGVMSTNVNIYIMILLCYIGLVLTLCRRYEGVLFIFDFHTHKGVMRTRFSCILKVFLGVKCTNINISIIVISRYPSLNEEGK